jgi:hypothetical protein
MKAIGYYNVKTTNEFNKLFSVDSQYKIFNSERIYLYIDISDGCYNIDNLYKKEYGFIIKNIYGEEIFYPFWSLEVEGLDVEELKNKYSRIEVVEGIIE